MPSTYSSNLKIELQATGENSNTWGTITNTNLGTALEQAIVGYGNPNYASDANLTLTYTDTNAAQAARALVLNVTSSVSLTNTRELVVPTIQKQYIVQNNTTGSQSITVKTAAGSGVTVPNGRKAHLYVNGTDVIQMFDFVDINGGAIDGTPIGAGTASTGAFTTLSGTTLTLTNPLAVNQGGTGQTSYTDGQLLIGNSTGNTLTKSTLTAGSGVSITNGSGAITIAATGSGGTVTSVGLSLPAIFSVSGSPVTGAGTLTGTLASQSANLVFASPNGAPGAPTFRSLVAADVPTLNQNTTGTASNVTGIVAVANGGTGQSSYTDGQLLIGNSSGNTLTKATLTAGAGVSITNGSGAITIAATGSGGTVTSVGQTFTGGLISVGGSPITGAGTLALTVAGTSGGIPYFSSGTTWASSAALAANALVIGGGAGAAPSTTTTGTGVLTALGNNANATGGFATTNGTATLTNKRINPRVVSAASASSLTPDISAADQYCYTALAAGLTINAPTGTPVDGNKLVFRILDNGTSRTLTWNATYTPIGVTLPTATTINKTLYVGCIYNANNTRWDVVAVTTQA